MTVFDRYAREYDRWFDENERLYRAEVNALRRMVPQSGKSIEIGAGTGRFTLPLGITLGVEPSRPMALIAQQHGLSLCQAVGELLPFPEKSFDTVLVVTVVCFVPDPFALFREILRVLKPGGVLISGFIDRESALGRVYEAQKDSNKFYQQARFYSVDEIATFAQRAGLSDLAYVQTIMGMPGEMTDFDRVADGHGKGAFVVLSARKM